MPVTRRPRKRPSDGRRGADPSQDADRLRPHEGTVPDRSTTIVVMFLFLVYAVVLLRTAWVNEDAYITLRTVDNFVNGYGMRWNIAERVQTFTHPLWFFLITLPYLFTREAFYTVMVLSLLISSERWRLPCCRSGPGI